MHTKALFYYLSICLVNGAASESSTQAVWFFIILWRRFVKFSPCTCFTQVPLCHALNFTSFLYKKNIFNSCCYISYFSYTKIMLWKVQDHTRFSQFFCTRWPSYRLCGILNLQQQWGCLATAGDSGKLLRPMNKSCPPYATHNTPLYCACFCV